MRYRRENEVEPQYEVPKRLIFYRGEMLSHEGEPILSLYIDGVSENQFQAVLEKGINQWHITILLTIVPKNYLQSRVVLFSRLVYTR